MHWKDLKEAGESESKLYLLNAWRESPVYTDRERAALEWTEAVTLVDESRVPESVYQKMREHFTEKEQADLTLAITSINSWNRFSIAFRTEVPK